MIETELAAGHVLGRYELLLPIAKGGMAQVWAARLLGTRGFRKIVAVKTILRGTIDDTRMERMFLEEASLASQIHHPNVVQVLELGEHDGTLYLTMEWVDGEPLHYILAHAQERGGLPLPIAVNIVGQACKGLHAAHDLRDENGELIGLVHRDISPQNVLVTYTGTTKLVDFGIAKATSRVGTLTEAGELKGKFAYMSPEQVNGAPLDRRSDVFAIGVLLYMLTTNRHPFKGEHPGETVKNICSELPALPPRKFVKDYPPALEEVVLKALHKDPERRWGTALELLSALEEALPDYLEGSFEIEVSKYLGEILGHRSGERRRQLKLAEERLDGIRLNSSTSLSALGIPSSLGAVAIDRSAPPQSRSQPGASLPEPVPVLPSSPNARARRILAVAAIPAALGLGVFLGYQEIGGQRAAANSAAAAASPVPAATYPTLAPAKEAPVVAEPEAEPLPEPEPARRTATPVPTAKPPGRAPATPLRGRKAPAAETAPAPPPAPATASAPPVEEAPRPAPPKPDKPGVNAWDPTTFGGRH